MSDFEFALPEQGATTEFKPRILAAQFGDGYEQRVPDGINTTLAKWGVKFIVPITIGQEIETFLKDRGASSSFTWTPPGETEIVVVCRSWKRARFAAHWEINAQFDEVPA